MKCCIKILFGVFFYSSKVHNMEDEVATRRAQITQKIHETHHGMFSNNHRMQPVQTGQPDAR